MGYSQKFFLSIVFINWDEKKSNINMAVLKKRYLFEHGNWICNVIPGRRLCPGCPTGLPLAPPSAILLSCCKVWFHPPDGETHSRCKRYHVSTNRLKTGCVGRKPPTWFGACCLLQPIRFRVSGWSFLLFFPKWGSVKVSNPFRELCTKLSGPYRNLRWWWWILVVIPGVWWKYFL